MRIPVTPNLHIERFAGGQIFEASSYGINVIFEQYANGSWYATQRPGINKFEDASDAVSDERGRGVYYWDSVGKKYFVNDGNIYQDSYASTPMVISPGTERVYFAEVGEYLVITDAENNEGWYIHQDLDTTLIQLTNATNGFPLEFVQGSVALNGKLFLLTPDADVVECKVENPLIWDPQSFIRAESAPDAGRFITRHHEHVVAFGTRTIEFFYDAGNPPPGSTLSSRTDISYDTGAVNGNHVWEDSDTVFFVGQTRTGGIGVYTIQGFQLNHISNEDHDSFISSSVLDDGMSLLANGFQSGGRLYYCLTIFDLLGTPQIITQETTLVYSSTKDWWGGWNLAFPEVDNFPVVAWTKSTTTRNGEGMLSNGDLITVADDFHPNDTTGSAEVFEANVFVAGVFTVTGQSGFNIPIEIRTGQVDSGTRKRKFMSECFCVATPTPSKQTMTVSWADNQNNTYDQAGEIDTSDAGSSISRLGSYRQRDFRLNYDGDEQIRIEGLEVTVR